MLLTHPQRNDSADLTGRNPDGTFTKGSEVAKAAGHKGGQHSHDHDGEKGGEQEAEEIVRRGAHH